MQDCRTKPPILCRKIKQVAPTDMLMTKRGARTCSIPKLMKRLSRRRKLSLSYTWYRDVQFSSQWELLPFLPSLSPAGCLCGILEWVASLRQHVRWWRGRDAAVWAWSRCPFSDISFRYFTRCSSICIHPWRCVPRWKWIVVGNYGLTSLIHPHI